MQEHFSSVAHAYNEIRTTDHAPVRFIHERLHGPGPVSGMDLGTGAGRYAVLLLREIPGLSLTCVDQNEPMLQEAARVLNPIGPHRFAVLCANVDALPIRPQSFDCISTFNAIHHFDLPAFFAGAREALRPGGLLFVYTRLPEQNRQTIWGRFFPGFAAKETRLYELHTIEDALGNSGGLTLESTRLFRYERETSLDRLVAQALGGHYSTFSLYGPKQFEEAVATFCANLRAAFSNTDDVRWTDENIMLTARAA